MQDRRVARLRAAWPKWQATRHEAGGALLTPVGLGPAAVTVLPSIACDDGLRWHPPATLPSLYDLARDDPPRETSAVRLRRVGPVTVPLGLGPIYGLGVKRGKPSSQFGQLAHDLRHRAKDPDHAWTSSDETDLERVLFLAFQFGYALTWEIWDAIAPYDLDEVGPILDAIWGLDPKASGGGGPTLSPSPPE